MSARRVGGVVLSGTSFVGALLVDALNLTIPGAWGFPLLWACLGAGLIGLLLVALPSKSDARSDATPRPARGGNATVAGNGIAKGGGGGALGAGDGGSAFVGGDGMALGGEAGQLDRGGRNPIHANGGPNTQLPDGTWWFDYGRGGGPGRRIVLVPDVEISEAVAFAFFRQWGRTFSEAAKRTNASVDEVTALVSSRLAQGELSAWRRCGADWAILDRSELANGLDRESLLAGRGELQGRAGEFDEILVNRAQFEALWPRYFEKGEMYVDPGLSAVMDWRPN